MLRHVIIWKCKEGFTEEENRAHKAEVKAELEALNNLIDEVVELRVITEALPTSNMDVMLDSRFADADALERYRVHPEHVRVGKIVNTWLEGRACVDYME